MNVVIKNYVGGSYLLEREPEKWDAIVILDSGAMLSDFVPKHARRWVALTFDDVSRELPGKRAPMLADVRDAIDFSRGSANLLVCCRAGQSRSAAIAFAAYYAHGVTDATAILNPRRHVPNERIIQLAATALSDSSILSVYDAWKLANQSIRLVDHVDEIEREQDAIESLGARNRIVDSSKAT